MRGRWVADERGVAMIEATIGTVLLVLAALIVIQLVLVFHGALAVQSAAARAARALALTEEVSAAQQVYAGQEGTALHSLTWEAPFCRFDNGGTVAVCEGAVHVPIVFPGAGLFGGGGLTGPLIVREKGYYPKGRVGG